MKITQVSHNPPPPARRPLIYSQWRTALAGLAGTLPAALSLGWLLSALLLTPATAQSFQRVTPIDNTVGNGDILSDATVTDAAGNTYTTGSFSGTVAFGTSVLVSRGHFEAFVAKQDPTGAWLWAVRAGGTGDDRGTGIALDGSGNVLASGNFRGTGGDFGATLLSSAGGTNFDAWVGKLNGATGAWMWATRGGGTDSETSRTLAVDGAGNAFVAGTFEGMSARFGGTVLASAGVGDVWVAKVNGANGAWLWAKQAGGTYYDDAHDIALDGAGNAFVTGSFSSMSASFGAITLHTAGMFDGDPDVWVGKLNGSTGAWQWAQSGGSPSTNNSLGYDNATGIALDPAGNPLITGYIDGPTATFGAFALTTNGSSDVLVGKLNGSTGAWLWVQTGGGSASDAGTAISVDAAGNALLVGGYSSPDAQFGPTMLVADGQNGNMVVAKVSGNTGAWLWATSAGGPNTSLAGTDLGMDGAGNPIITGNYTNYDGQVVPFGALTLAGNPHSNIVMGKLNGATGSWTRVNNASVGTGSREATATTVDAAGNVYVTGTFSSTATFGATTLTSAGYADVYVAKQDPSGTWLWAVRAGSASASGESSNSLTLDASGNLLLTGSFGGDSLAFGAITLVNSNVTDGSSDVWVAKLNGITHTWMWATSGGGSQSDYATGIAVDGAGDALISGYFGSADAVFGIINVSATDSEDLLTAKLNGMTGTWMWAKRAGSSSYDQLTGIAVDGAGNGFVTGHFSGPDAHLDGFTLASAGSGDALVGKFDGATGAWLWATRGGGTDYESGYAIALDAAGNPLITGTVNADAQFGSIAVQTAGANNVLIAKLNGSTGAWLWAAKGGGNQGGESGTAIAVDAAGNGFITGSLRGGVTCVFGPSTFQTVPGATGTRQDVVVAKFNGSTGVWLWAKSAGGGETDLGQGIALDNSNHLVVVGTFLSNSAAFGPITLYGGTANSTGFVAQLLDQPTITRFAPAAAPVGTLVTATGTLLSGTSLITFAGGATAVPTNVTATSLQFVIPMTANTGAVQATTPLGPGPSTTPLTVVRDLIVSTPATTILPGPYRTITITGTGEGVLGGDVSVSTALLVRTGGSLDDACHRLTGAGSFTLQAGASLAICDAGGLALTGATGMVQVTGARAFSAAASYTYDGVTAQVTGSGLPATVQNLTISAPLGVDLSQPVGVKQVLNLPGAGNFRLHDNRLTLLSDAVGTAMLVNGGTGRVLGTATVQRYVTPNGVFGRAYRHFSSPVSGATVAGLTCAGFTPVVNPAYNTAPDPLTVMPYPNVFGFDETRYPASPDFAKGYYSPTSLSAPLTVGRGYSVYFPGTSKPSFVGPLNQEDVTLTGLTQTGNFGGAQEKSGWHLLGNPFPAPLDWDLLTLPSGMSSAVAVYQPTSPTAGQYLTRANGVGYLTDGLIAMGQGFFVQVTGAGPVDLTLPSAARQTTYGSPAHYRAAPDARPALGLTLRAVGTPTAEATGTTVYFQPGATTGVDATFDGPQPAHNVGLPTLVSVVGATELAVNGLPEAALAQSTVELLAELPVAGTYELAVGHLAHLTGQPVALLDRLTQTRYELTAATPILTFTVSAANQSVRGRFALVFGTNRVNGVSGEAGATPTLTVWPNPARSAVYVEGAAPGTPLTLLDATGRVVRTAAAQGPTSALSVEALPAGVYLLRVGAQTKRLVVE